MWLLKSDERVRETHAYLDGQLVHAQGEFTSNSGAKAQYPGGFGIAAEDINCRCTVKYTLMKKDEFLAQGGVIPGEENAKQLKGNYSVKFEKASGSPEITQQLAQEFSDEYDKFQEKFGNISTVRSVEILPYENDGVFGKYNDNSEIVSIYGAGGKNGKATLTKVASDMKKTGQWSTSSPYHSFRHELGHALQKQLKSSDPNYSNKLERIKKVRENILNSLTGLPESDIIDIEKRTLSRYGLTPTTGVDEFISECIAEGMLPEKKQRSTAKTVVNILLEEE